MYIPGLSAKERWHDKTAKKRYHPTFKQRPAAHALYIPIKLYQGQWTPAGPSRSGRKCRQQRP
jgi:hypothetical protein